MADTPLPAPPFWAVIFTSRRTADDDDGYDAMAQRMDDLARRQPGFLGVESVRQADRLGITVSYWTTEAAVAAWKAEVEHREAQRLGVERWYEYYSLQVARVERAYGFTRPAD
jgi:heme-degrading monooxygenase HmoA